MIPLVPKALSSAPAPRQPHDRVVGVVPIRRGAGAEHDHPPAGQCSHTPGVVGDVALPDRLARPDVDAGRATLAEGGVGFAGGVEADDGDVGVLGRGTGRLRILLHRARDHDLAVGLDGDGPGDLDGLAADRHVDRRHAALTEGRIELPVGAELGHDHGVVATGAHPPGGVQASVRPVGHRQQPVMGVRSQR